MSWLNRIISRFNEPDKLFYLGQEITPKDNNPKWAIKGTFDWQAGPKFGEIVRVIKYACLSEGQWYIQITGYANYFDESQFAPVITDKQLEKLLKEVDTITTVTHGTW